MERDIRLEDYINDKIQTAADLGNLASLIYNVEIQKKQLEDQLEDARSKLEQARNASTDHTTSMLKRTQEFKEHQDSVQRRLQIVTSSETPTEAVQRLKGPMEKLRKLEIAKLYVDLLKEVDMLINQARSQLPDNPKEALKPYTRLKELSLYLRELQQPAEGAAIHLITYVEGATSSLWVEMKKIMSGEFEVLLQRSNWPSQEEPTQEWGVCFGKLLDLQTPEIMTADEPLVLLPMSVLTKTFVQQFRYHFMSDKPTNHPHKLGDYFFEWFIGTVTKWENFLRDNIGPILASNFRGSKLSGNSLYVDPVSAFITALLPVLKEKVDSLVAAISREPQYMSSFMIQLMDFDEKIRTRFNYDGGNLEYGWKGLSWGILENWFDRWQQIEKDFALERYQEILESPDSGLIDYDSVGPGKTKPTYGAIKVMDLLKTVTNQYSMVRKFSHKIAFLIDIQATILDKYYERLNDSLEAYQSLTSTVGRTLHGVTKEERAALEGIGGLQSLCKVFGSADYIISILQEWTDEEFFVTLWDQLQNKAKRVDREDNLAGSMSFTDVKERTSDSVGTEADVGSVFDVTISQYQQLQKRAEILLTDAIKHSFPSAFKSYLSKAQWTTIDEEENPETNPSIFGPTAELAEPLRMLDEHMAFLSKAIAQAPFRRIWRNCVDSLQNLLWNDILMVKNFTTRGAEQFKSDIAAINGIISSHIGNDSMWMPKLGEGVELLNLPLDSPDGGISIKQASDAVFASNLQAKEILERLGFTLLSNTDSRAILQRRVEASD
ncbi:TIP-1 family-domain-containing protein [Xylogone sp. PMI_703]|nr:TIP-1 family-domain-containing protein [Xylogone sp. PMI_703]